MIRRTPKEDEVMLFAGMKPQARELESTQGLDVMVVLAVSPFNENNANQRTKRRLLPW
jgi:hypothetical protein